MDDSEDHVVAASQHSEEQSRRQEVEITIGGAAAFLFPPELSHRGPQEASSTHAADALGADVLRSCFSLEEEEHPTLRLHSSHSSYPGTSLKLQGYFRSFLALDSTLTYINAHCDHHPFHLPHHPTSCDSTISQDTEITLSLTIDVKQQDMGLESTSPHVLPYPATLRSSPRSPPRSPPRSTNNTTTSSFQKRLQGVVDPMLSLNQEQIEQQQQPTEQHSLLTSSNVTRKPLQSLVHHVTPPLEGAVAPLTSTTIKDQGELAIIPRFYHPDNTSVRSPLGSSPRHTCPTSLGDDTFASHQQAIALIFHEAAAAVTACFATEGNSSSRLSATTVVSQGDEGGEDENETTHNACRPSPRPISPSSCSPLPLPPPSFSLMMISLDAFVSITKDICGFPSFFNAPLWHRIIATTTTTSSSSSSSTTHDGRCLHAEDDMSDMEDRMDDAITPQRISFSQLEAYWHAEMAPYDPTERFFRLLAQPGATTLHQSDFTPFMTELLMYHPGLDFLTGTPEFQEKYALTVVIRIFYALDKRHCGALTLRDVRKSNLMALFTLVDEEEDINKVTHYFSYEHFYVLYCKFWELDTAHQFHLTREDVLRYGGHCLTASIIDRIFEVGARPFGQPRDSATLSYADFVVFMLSEEDKSNDVSLQYWFECVDVNGDGVLTRDEMTYFYDAQMTRMEALGHELVPFEDILCQLCDLIAPAQNGVFTMQDFKAKRSLSGVFFNVLFNLSKFIAFEQRDPFAMRQALAEPSLTDWDRYARTEYARLAMEEESRDEEEGTMEIADELDGWYMAEEDSDDRMMQDVPSSFSSLNEMAAASNTYDTDNTSDDMMRGVKVTGVSAAEAPF